MNDLPEENPIEEWLAPLRRPEPEYPQVDPREDLFAYFHGLIDSVAETKSIHKLVYLLFQKELMLRRVPDPRAVHWVNGIVVTGDLGENEMLYARYVVHKWLASLPALFPQISCLRRVHLAKEHFDHTVTGYANMVLPAAMFLQPDLATRKLMEAFVETIPYFDPKRQELRSATWLMESVPFSFDEWWQALLRSYNADHEKYRDFTHGELIARRLAAYLEEPKCLAAGSTHPIGSLVDILAHAEINGYVA